MRAIPKGLGYPNAPTGSARPALVTSQLCLALHCNLCAFPAEVSPVLGKIQILFIAHYFLPFHYSVIPSEKCVLCRVQKKFCPYQYMMRWKTRWQQIESWKKPGSYIMYRVCWYKWVFKMIMSLSLRPALPWSWISGAGVPFAAHCVCWSFSLFPIFEFVCRL